VSLTLKVTREFETFWDALEEAVDRLERYERFPLVVLIDESSIAGSSSMRKAMKNGSGSRGRRQ
jgi:hypothetical protein